jgi:hypothetical protein
MIATETQQFARFLTHKLAELTNQRQTRDRITVETSSDEVEECLLAAERYIAWMDLGRTSSTCRQIEAALERVPAATGFTDQFTVAATLRCFAGNCSSRRYPLAASLFCLCGQSAKSLEANRYRRTSMPWRHRRPSRGSSFASVP